MITLLIVGAFFTGGAIGMLAMALAQAAGRADRAAEAMLSRERREDDDAA